MVIIKLEVPLKRSDNRIMMKIKDREVGEGSKMDNKIVVNLFGEGFCRGDRWIELNEVEWLVMMGSDFVDGYGFEECLERVEKLLNGESFMMEFEEKVVCVGNKSRNEVEVDYCKGKIELLKG